MLFKKKRFKGIIKDVTSFISYLVDLFLVI